MTSSPDGENTPPSGRTESAAWNLVDRVNALSNMQARRAAVLAGALLSAGFAPLSLFPAAFVAIPVLVLLLDRSPDARDAFAIGWWFGFGHFLTGLYWVGISFASRDDVPDWGGVLASLALAIALAYFTAFAAMLARSYWHTGWRRILIFAVAFSGFEWLRGHVFTGFPWNLIVNVWERLDGMVQAASLVGSYGIGFLTILSAASLVLLIPGRQPARVRSVSRMALPIASAAALVLLWGWGEAEIARTPTSYHSDVSLRIVQASIPQREKWKRDKLGDNFVRHLQMSVEDGPDGNASAVTHVIWPETATPYFLNSMPSKRHLIARALGSQRILITGVRRLVSGPEPLKLYNSVQAIGTDGAIVANYDKHHLVPFGEYLPLRWILGVVGLGSLVEDSIDFSEGPGPQTLTIPGLPPVGALVCYEVIFPGAVVDPANRPQWLLNLTNDAWFGNSSGPYQHLVMARFRAAEEGLPIVRAAGTGISAVIDPLGRVLESLPLNRAGVLDVRLPRPAAALTLYARLGDWIYLVLLLVAAATALFRRPATTTIQPG